MHSGLTPRHVRNDVVKVPIDFGPGVPAFRIDSAIQVPLDPSFPKSIFHVPWIAYLSAELAAGVTLAREVLTERTPDGGLLMSATTERLDPTNPEHVRCARILAETLIAAYRLCLGEARERRPALIGWEFLDGLRPYKDCTQRSSVFKKPAGAAKWLVSFGV